MEAKSTWSLAGQTALVTGGTRGIGRAIAEELAGHGALVYVCARSEAHVQECVRAWKEAGLHGIDGSACDVTSSQACMELISTVSRHFSGRLNILVNNAGIVCISSVLDLPFSDYSRLIGTNMESAYHLSQLAHPLLKASGRGSIVFNSSVAGLIALSDASTVYSMTKGAINQLTRCLAFEWAKDNIRVNAIAPGYVLTDMINVLPAETKQAIAARVPLGRLASPCEVSAVVAFLCMPCASYMTGSIIPVDGGYTTHNSI